MKDKSNMAPSSKQLFYNMFSTIFLDHFLNLRITHLLDFFKFSGFSSDLKVRAKMFIHPISYGGSKIYLISLPGKNISKRNSFTCFLKISDKFEKSFIRSWIIAILSMVKPSANVIIRPKYTKITFKFVIFHKTLPVDLVWSKIKQNWAKLLTIWRHHDVILTLWRRHESIITHNTFMTTS